jgi:hypothetical protein
MSASADRPDGAGWIVESPLDHLHLGRDVDGCVRRGLLLVVHLVLDAAGQTYVGRLVRYVVGPAHGVFAVHVQLAYPPQVEAGDLHLPVILPAAHARARFF